MIVQSYRVEELKSAAQLTPLQKDQLYHLAVLLRPELEKNVFDEMVDYVIDFSGNCILVALDERQNIVGMLTLVSYPLFVGYKKTWIEDVVVSAEVRGQGVGKALVVAALDTAKRMGVSAVNLSSRPSLEAANKLYRSLGFEIVDTNYYRKIIN